MSKRKNKHVAFFLYPIIASAVIVFIYQKSGLQLSSPVISPLPSDTAQPKSIKFLFSSKKNPDDLKRQLIPIIDMQWNNFSLFVKDLNSGFELDINKSVIFTAASINKIPILAALYYSVQKGEIDLDKTITLQKNDIQDYGTGSIRYDPPGTVYSIKTLARLMMQKSDNTAAYILANHILTVDTIQSLMNSWGLSQTDIVNNKTSNNDIAIIMEKIYGEKIANTAFTQEMLSLLKDSDFEDRLPRLLPKETDVYHKIGTEVGAVHDTGIIVTPKITYYLGIFTSDVRDEEQAAELMAKLSKAVYDFFN